MSVRNDVIYDQYAAKNFEHGSSADMVLCGSMEDHCFLLSCVLHTGTMSEPRGDRLVRYRIA